jgi:hypothetical protein
MAMMMKDYGVSVQIDATPERVWAVMRDIERWHEWTPTVTRVRRTNEGPFQIGARARVWQPRLPPADWVVTAFDDGRGFEWESRVPGLRVLARHHVAQGIGGSRVTLSIQFSGLLGGLLGRLTGSFSKRYIALEADGLKRRAEAFPDGA